MARPTPEAVLISALINIGDPLAAEKRGITPQMLPGHEAEYRWLLSYHATYNGCPAMRVLQHKFPDFVATDEDDIDYACDEVRHAHTRRDLTRTIRASAQALKDGDIEEAMFALASFSPPTARQLALIDTLTNESLLDDEAAASALRTPWATLNSVTGGVRRGDLWYVAARLGQGKSWTLASMAKSAVLDGHRVLLFSMEMPERQVQARLHASLADSMGIDVTHTMLRDRTFDLALRSRLVGAIKEQVTGTLHVYDSSRGPVNPSIVKAMSGDYDLVLIDYAGLMTAPSGSRAVDDWRVMATISNMLKESALSVGTPIVAAAQINRDGESSGWRPPKVVNLSQSDALGQDGDVVMTHKQYGKTAMVYSVEKNRHGRDGVKFFTSFDPDRGRLNEISKAAADELRDEDGD